MVGYFKQDSRCFELGFRVAGTQLGNLVWPWVYCMRVRVRSVNWPPLLAVSNAQKYHLLEWPCCPHSRSTAIKYSHCADYRLTQGTVWSWCRPQLWKRESNDTNGLSFHGLIENMTGIFIIIFFLCPFVTSWFLMLFTIYYILLQSHTDNTFTYTNTFIPQECITYYIVKLRKIYISNNCWYFYLSHDQKFTTFFFIISTK